MNYADLKIGKLVQTVLKPLIISKATKQEISKMQELEYSKATFGIQYPLLLKTSSAVKEKHYYSELITLYGETYRLCSEWYETASNNDRPYVEKWIREHETFLTCAEPYLESKKVSNENTGICSNKPKKQALYGMLKTLDPVAVHTEYYDWDPGYTGGCGCRGKCANGKWLVCARGKKCYIMDETGESKVYVELGDAYKDIGYSGPLYGMNNKGIWFGLEDNSSGFDRKKTGFLCFNPETGVKKVFNTDPEYVIKEAYIYEDTVYYVASKYTLDETYQKLVKMEIVDGFLGEETVETVLYRTKGTIRRVCADANRVAFQIGVNCWCIMDTDGYIQTYLGQYDDPIKIKIVDLKNNVVWTTMTEEECEGYNAQTYDLIERELENPTEYNYRGSSPNIFKVGARFGSCCSFYFDGKNMYYARVCGEFIRCDRYGKENIVGCGHGNTEHFFVSNAYVFVAYDMFDISRLPRNFSNSHLCGRENPEAAILFDED